MTCYTKPSRARDGRDALVGFANVAIIQGTRGRALLFPTFPRVSELVSQQDPSGWLLTEGVSEEEHSVARATWKAHLSLDDKDIFDVDVSELMTKGGGPHCFTKQYQFSPGRDRRAATLM